MKVICGCLFNFVVWCVCTTQIVRALSYHCSNPNNRNGVCVPIGDCQTLWSVLQRIPFQLEDEQFLRASRCGNHYGDSDFLVCCSSDTGFVRQQFNYNTNSNSNNNNNNDDDDSTNFYWRPQKQLQNTRTFLFPQNDFESPPLQQPKRQQKRVSSGNAKPVKRNRNAANTSLSLLPQPPNCGSVTFGNRIYGGENAELFEFPWMVLFEYQRKEGGITVDCAGSLINNRYVLTAAHCVKGPIESNRQLVAIRLGEHDTTSSIDCLAHTCAPQAYRVAIEEIIQHELYNDRSHENDIALVRLQRNVQFSENVKPICLPSKNRKGTTFKSGTEFTVAGWGQTLKAPNSPIKQKLVVSFVDEEKCSNRFREKKVIIKETQLCAGGKFSEDSCKGDSGGPLMRVNGNAWRLEGIVSFGNSCGRLNWPAVHTKVASYVNWIQSQLRA